jgi:hypothetical protein
MAAQIVRADEKLTAFLELEMAIQARCYEYPYLQTITMSNLCCTTER